MTLLIYSWKVFLYGGWLLYAGLGVYIFMNRFKKHQQRNFRRIAGHVFLNIKIPKENLVSTLQVESIFASLHAALEEGFTWYQKYIEGRQVLWYSLELVSLGGKVSFIVRTFKPFRELVESAFYSAYPQAEINEVSDYLQNLEYDPENSHIDLWGTELKLAEEHALPIKTYKDFEHLNAEEQIIDPLRNLYESMGAIEPHEFFGVQIVIQPYGDGLKKKAEKLIRQLIDQKDGTSDNNWTNLTDGEKKRVTLIEKKMKKAMFRTKIRLLYISPKDRHDPNKKDMILGCFKPFGSAFTNKLEPDYKYTWTNANYVLSPSLEKDFLQWRIKRRKKKMFIAYKKRSKDHGYSRLYLNTEELASLFHFPITNSPLPNKINHVETKTSQVPAGLPVAEY